MASAARLRSELGTHMARQDRSVAGGGVHRCHAIPRGAGAEVGLPASAIGVDELPELRAVVGARKRVGGDGFAQEFAERLPSLFHLVDE